MKVVNKESCSQQKVKNPEEDTSSVITGGAKDVMMKTISKLEVVNEVSVSLKEGTPWEADKGIGAASKNEYSAHPASSLNSKRKVSIPLEGIDPLEIFEEMNMNESGEDSALDAESIFAFKVSSGKEESGSWPLNAWDRSTLHSKTSTL